MAEVKKITAHVDSADLSKTSSSLSLVTLWTIPVEKPFDLVPSPLMYDDVLVVLPFVLDVAFAKLGGGIDDLGTGA